MSEQDYIASVAFAIGVGVGWLLTELKIAIRAAFRRPDSRQETTTIDPCEHIDHHHYRG